MGDLKNPVSFFVDDETLEKLRAVAEEQRETVSSVLREALDQHLAGLPKPTSERNIKATRAYLHSR